MTQSVFQSTACTRCSGTGTFPPYGRCVRCEGRGREHTRIGHRAYLYAKAMRAKGVPVWQCVARALSFQQMLLERNDFSAPPYEVLPELPPPAGVPEKKKKRRKAPAAEAAA